MLVRVLLASGALTISGAALAQDASQRGPADAAATKKICRTVVPTGSIMGKRICLTKAEWARLNATNEKSAEALRDRQTRGSIGPGAGTQ